MRKCEDFEVLITGYIDGELDDLQEKELKDHLKTCESCRRELERSRIMKDTLDMMAVRTPEDDFWDGYWAGIYNRMERQSSCFLFGFGVIVLAAGSLITVFRDLLFGDNTPLWATVGGILTLFGTTGLIVSLVRERIRINRNERYKDVRR